MKKLTAMMMVVGLVLALATSAQATVVTLTFDPNDLIDLAPSDSSAGKAVQENGRRVHQTWKSVAYGTFSDNLIAGHTQPNDYNTYMNWRDGLTGANEGIAAFNNWFLGWSGALTWGENVVAKTDAPISATTTAGWNWREVREPYRSQEGASIQFWTDDPGLYLRNGGTDIGLFSITADLYYDTNGDKMYSEGDVGVDDGDILRMWLGNLNGDDAPYYMSGKQAIYFDDQGWGEREDAADPFAAVYSTAANTPLGSGFEGVLTVTASAVPEPNAALVWGFLALAAAAFKLRRRAA